MGRRRAAACFCSGRSQSGIGRGSTGLPSPAAICPTTSCGLANRDGRRTVSSGKSIRSSDSATRTGTDSSHGREDPELGGRETEMWSGKLIEFSLGVSAA